MESLSLPAPPYSPSDPSTWIAASQIHPKGVNVPVGNNNFGLLKFGDEKNTPPCTQQPTARPAHVVTIKKKYRHSPYSTGNRIENQQVHNSS